MSTFDQDEASVQFNRPIEFYDIALSTGVTYRIASGPRDLQVGSLLYTAAPAARTDLEVAQADGNSAKALSLSLPVTHAVVRRWFQYGVPPRQVTVTAWRKQERSGAVSKVWSGLVTEIVVDGVLAKLSIPSRTLFQLQRMLPTITSGQTCVHVLYDSTCKVARAAFSVTATAIAVDGRKVRVDMGAARLSPWAQGGEIVHTPTGERMTIATQTDIDPASSTLADLTLQTLIPEMRAGDGVAIYAGCLHDVITCNQKFANQPNFFGDPYKTTKNPFFPTHFGVIEQA